jgi:hypothetical protein
MSLLNLNHQANKNVIGITTDYEDIVLGQRSATELLQSSFSSMTLTPGNSNKVELTFNNAQSCLVDDMYLSIDVFNNSGAGINASIINIFYLLDWIKFKKNTKKYYF